MQGQSNAVTTFATGCQAKEAEAADIHRLSAGDRPYGITGSTRRDGYRPL